MNRVSTLADLRTALNESGTAFSAWWRQELVAMLPKRFQSSLMIDAHRIVVEVDGPHVTITEERHAGPTGSYQRTSLFDGTLDASRVFFRSRGRQLAQWVPLVLRVPSSACLVRNVSVPAAALSRLPQVLALNLEHATPFRGAEMYSAQFVPEGGDLGEAITVTHVAYKKVAASALLDALASAGLKLSWIEAVDESGELLPVRLVPAEQVWPLMPPGLRILTRVSQGLAILLATGSVATASLAIWKSESTVALVERDVADLQKKAASIRQQLSVQEKTKTDAASLRLRKLQGPLLVALMDELSRVTPDQAFIGEMQVTNDEVVIDGWAKAAADLVGLLTTSKYFADAAFVAPVTRDPARGAEHFRIRLKLAQADQLASKGAKP
jgi:general secretion pathway protein L